MASIEEKVEDYYKSQLKHIGQRVYNKTESVNSSIDTALREANSKSGNNGSNYPDMKLFLQNRSRRDIPAFIEAKGSKGRLEKLTKAGDIELVSGGKDPRRAIKTYAVNGAIHYGNAVLAEGTYKEVICIGVNGTKVDSDGNVIDPECKAYYISKKNNGVPKVIPNFDVSMLRFDSIDAFYALLDTLNLTEAEIEKLTLSREAALEKNIKAIHQRIYDDESIRYLLSTTEKLYLFIGLIMAGLPVDGVKPLDVDDFFGNDDDEDNDGVRVVTRIRAFLRSKKLSLIQISRLMGCLQPVFSNRSLWAPINGESILKSIYKQVKSDIVPLFEGNIHLDFAGRIMNSLNDWVGIDNDTYNDVVLTPRYVARLMAELCDTNMDSRILDVCMGSAGLLVSGMELAFADAKRNIHNVADLDAKLEEIKSNQIMGVEILTSVYVLSLFNMILMGNTESQFICDDAHKVIDTYRKFDANVFLLNPPYSAPGKGLIFVDEALSTMTSGYGCVLIQENSGSGQGDVYSKHMLKHNTLVASIHMPINLFGNKSSVQTAIYLFKVGRPHEVDDIVTFIDFSEDGYARQNRRKSTQAMNLRNVDHAEERYAEIVAICKGKQTKTNYYTEENDKVIKDTITLNGDDWTFNQHKKMDLIPTEEDFKKTVADYLAWKVTQVLKNRVKADV